MDLGSGVSGGSFTAAYYGLHGDGLFEDFDARFLNCNVQRDLVSWSMSTRSSVHACAISPHPVVDALQQRTLGESLGGLAEPRT